MHKLAQNLKSLRERTILSQKDVAEYVDVPQPRMNDYENGTREPSITVLIMLADFWGKTIDDLLLKDL